jgi:hypothetical protein
MKKLLLFLPLFFMAFPVFSQDPVPAPGPKDVAFLCDIRVMDTDQPSIDFSWKKDRFAAEYEIYRRRLDQSNDVWELLTTLDSSASSYKDRAIAAGVGYEYQLMKKCERPDISMSYIGTAYFATGIGVPPRSVRGKSVLVLIDDKVQPLLTDEINQWQVNVQKEGWNVIIVPMPRTEKFDKDAVLAVKAKILQEAKIHNTITTVMLVGRIAVPYSGNIRPDGHPDHTGAWPADVFYADTNGKWTDATINTDNNPAGQQPTREQNRNIPNDGKFDQSSLPSDIDLAVGRIDFYDLPVFFNKDKHATMFDSEIQLLKRYFKKNHDFRTGTFVPNRRGLIDDNFGSYGEYFAVTAWSGFSALTGTANVSALKWYPTLTTDDYLFAYGCGAGNYTSVGGVSNLLGFSVNKTNAVHTMLFGSYLGDWDSQDNVLRGSLGSEGMNLTTCWSGRPHWFHHKMAVGYTIGENAVVSINNQPGEVGYVSSVIVNNTYPNGVILTAGVRGVHNALLGDPTLQMEQNVNGSSLTPPQPPKNLIIESLPTHKALRWDKSADAEGYIIYRTSSTLPKASFSLITSVPVKENFYNDSVTDNKSYRYSVQAIKKKVSDKAIYFLGSDTVMKRATITSVDDRISEIEPFTIMPNPARTFTDIDCRMMKQPFTIHIVNSAGELVKIIEKNAPEIVRWNLVDDCHTTMSSGNYYIHIRSGASSYSRMISIVQ